MRAPFVTSLASLLVAATGAAGGAADGHGTRNVILFVGDGMSVATVTAARIFEGQQRGETGEENYLAFEEFEHVALVKTYNTDMQVPDSAGTMTALVTGVKTRAGVLSIGPDAERGVCGGEETHVETIAEQAEAAGFKTGIISTARFTHATPAALYAHSADRNWEATTPDEACADIARQFVEFTPGDGIDVAFSGGRAMFLPNAVNDPEYTFRNGQRIDGRNLIDEWLSAHSDRHFVFDQAGFDQMPASGQLLGLFEPSHMQWEADRSGDPGGEPSLAEMTKRAIEHLRNDQGFFLMVESGRIDHAHHAGNAHRALVDTVAYADAVGAAVEATDPAETLIVVTADHSHTMTIAGYPGRGNPILGYVAAGGETQKDVAGNVYTTLSYANGPGATDAATAAREKLSPDDVDYIQDAAVPMFVETHGGDDVAAYAHGIGAEGIRGVMDQNEIYDVLANALFGGSN